MKRRLFLMMAALTGLLALAGCGGGKPADEITDDTPAARARVTINWAERSRAIDAPTSAMSVTIRIKEAQYPDKSDAVLTVNRGSQTSAFSQTYEFDEGVYVGNRRMEVTFFAGENGTGSVVATAADTLRIETNGTVLQPITNIQKHVEVVEVASGQSVGVGEEKYLAFTARRSNGEIVAISPGSAFFTVAGGGDKLRVNKAVAIGLSAGTAQVTATVDGITSAPIDVTIQAAVRIALVANGQEPQVIAFLQLLQARNITPTRLDAIPSPNELQQYDVLMLHASGNLGTVDAAKVEAYLNSGRGVVLLGRAPAVLATGNMELRAHWSGGGTDISSISSWFGGVTHIGDDANSNNIDARTTPGNFPLPSNILPGDHVYDANSADNLVAVVGSAIQYPITDRILSSNGNSPFYALAYELPSGGRVYWQFHPYGLNSTYSGKVLSLLLAGTNWTAKR